MDHQLKNIAIVGASGAIGSAFMNLLAEQKDVQKIYAFSRSPLSSASSKVKTDQIDITNESSIETAAQFISESLDLIILATGLLHQDNIMPEKSLKDLSFEKFEKIYAVNTIGPALVMKHFLPKLNRESKSIFAALSARVGSISDNQLGGWYSYRSSKAALNMLIKNASIEIARTNKQAIIIGLQPGTVDSHLSKPFQGHIDPEHLFTADYSAAKLLEVFTQLTPDTSGKCFDYKGEEILP